MNALYIKTIICLSFKHFDILFTSMHEMQRNNNALKWEDMVEIISSECIP